MKILIREGSAARNFDALIELLPEHHAQLMFCSDDKHPDTLLLGHIDALVRRAVALGHNVFEVLQVACLNPVAHYQLPVGQLRPGDAADFILVDNLTGFRVQRTYLDGELVAENGVSRLPAARVVRAQHDLDGRGIIFSREPRHQAGRGVHGHPDRTVQQQEIRDDAVGIHRDGLVLISHARRRCRHGLRDEHGCVVG